MKLLLRILLLVPFLLVAALAWLRLAHAPAPFPPDSRAAARLESGPFSVAEEDRRFVDTTRPTQANGDYPGSDRRELAATLWYPRDAESAVPLLLFSHGFTSIRGNGAYMAEHLASHGYAVVAVDYPLTSMRAPGGPNVNDVVNQPGDIGFLIDTLLAESAGAGQRLSGRLDAQRIGVFGTSLGGLTSTLAAYHPEWRDPRIGAAISIAGPTNFFTKQFFGRVHMPFLMLAGDLDALVPYHLNAAPVPDKVPGAQLVTISGGSHTAFSGGTVWFRALSNPDAVGCYAVLRNIGDDDDNDWAGLLGDEAQGIDYGARSELCRVDPLPAVLNVSRQQMITRVVVTAFFDQVFGADAATRDAAARFLSQTLPAEIAEVSYRSASRPGS